MADKKASNPATSAPKVQGAAGAPGAVAGKCAVADCKEKDKRFGFCNPHFEQFKFGLIRKNGVKASDYEKKMEHFKTFQAERKAA